MSDNLVIDEDPAAVSQEVLLIGQAVDGLLAIDEETRSRVMGYLVDRFGAGYSAWKVARNYWLPLSTAATRRSRLDAARVLLTELGENGLTPYREKIRAWLADED